MNDQEAGADERDDPQPGYSDYRCRAIELALSLDGLSAADDAYMDLVAPADVESAQMRAAMATMSSCALVARGIWRRLGVQHPILSHPYVIGHAVSDLVQIGNDLGAVRPRDDWGNIAPGDVVIVDGNKPTAHVYTVVGVTPTGSGSGLEISSVDGGQRIAGREGCLVIQRHIDAQYVDHRETFPASSRAVTAIINGDLLAASFDG